MSNNITIIRGNIFNTKSQTIVNTVNCVGVMGKGVALVYKLRYPDMFDKYQELCAQHLITIGKLWLYKGDSKFPWVLNFPTKTHWKMPSEYDYIEKGLAKFVETYREKGITSIAFPLLGANNGGLNPDVVLDIMRSHLSQCDIPVEIYLYDPAVADDLFETFKNKWNSIPAQDRKRVTGIRTQKQIDTLNDAVNGGKVNSMMTLLEFDGIGLATMQKCYGLVINYIEEPTLL